MLGNRDQFSFSFVLLRRSDQLLVLLLSIIHGSRLLLVYALLLALSPISDSYALI